MGDFNARTGELLDYMENGDNPEIGQDINVCKQLREAGLIQPTWNKIKEIFKKAVNFSLENNMEKPEQACKSTTKKKKKKWFDNECHQLRQKSRTLSNKKHNNQYDLEYETNIGAHLKNIKTYVEKKSLHIKIRKVESWMKQQITLLYSGIFGKTLEKEKKKLHLNMNMSMVINGKVSLKTSTVTQINILLVIILNFVNLIYGRFLHHQCNYLLAVRLFFVFLLIKQKYKLQNIMYDK